MTHLENISLTHIVFTILFILLLKYVFDNIIKPYKDYLFYKKILTANYKTEVAPFSLLGMSNIKKKNQEIQKYKDSHHYAKNNLTDYQVRLMKVGSGILIDIIDHELIKEFYEKVKQGCYVKKPTLIDIGKGLLTSEGNDWKKKKKILSHAFNFEFIQSKMKAISDIVQKNIEKVQNQGRNKDKQEVTYDITMFFQKTFGNVVINNFFGQVQLNDIEGKDVFEFLSQYLTSNVKQSLTAYSFFMNQLGIDYKKLALREIDREANKMRDSFRDYSKKIIYKIMNEAKQQKQSGKSIKSNEKGILWWIIYNDLFIDNQTEHSDQKYNLHELTDQIVTFFLAGTETTAKTLTSVMYKLGQSPQILAKMRKEVQEVIGSTPLKQLNNDVLKKMPYLDSVIKESLRMNPPLPNIFIRQAQKDHYLGKIPIKKGMQCSVKIITAHYDDKVYDKPHEFFPERWMQPDSVKAGSTYLPFSLGQRSCIGQQLAILQAKITMIELLKRYKSVKLQRPNYKRFQVGTYGPQRMQVYLTKI